MKTKLKDIILYSLAIAGAMSLFINATSLQPTLPKYEVVTTDNMTAFMYNRETGEVWGLKRTEMGGFSTKGVKIELEK